jgi:hypothetical protein
VLKIKQGGAQNFVTEFVEAHHHHGDDHGRNFEKSNSSSAKRLSTWVKQKSVAVFTASQTGRGFTACPRESSLP